jgi:hypothetical protein
MAKGGAGFYYLVSVFAEREGEVVSHAQQLPEVHPTFGTRLQPQAAHLLQRLLDRPLGAQACRDVRESWDALSEGNLR